MNKPFRTNFSERDPASRAYCVNPVLEFTKNYKLGFVEFDDQRWFWDRKQSGAVEKMIRDERGIGQPNSTQSLCVAVFVRGWKNNAATNNDNVEMFGKTLDQFGMSSLRREPKNFLALRCINASRPLKAFWKDSLNVLSRNDSLMLAS